MSLKETSEVLVGRLFGGSIEQTCIAVDPLMSCAVDPLVVVDERIDPLKKP